MSSQIHFISYKISHSGPVVLFHSSDFPYSYEEQMLLGAHSLMWGGQGERYIQGLIGPIPSPLNNKESVLLFGKVVEAEITEEEDYGFNYLVIVVLLPGELKDLIINNQILTILFSSYLNDVKTLNDFTQEQFNTLVKFLKPYFIAQMSILNGNDILLKVIHLAFDVFYTPIVLLDHELSVIQVNKAFTSLGLVVSSLLHSKVTPIGEQDERELYDFLIDESAPLSQQDETLKPALPLVTVVREYEIITPPIPIPYNRIREYNLIENEKHYGFLLELIHSATST